MVSAFLNFLTLQFSETAIPCLNPCNLVHAGTESVDLKARTVGGREQGGSGLGMPALKGLLLDTESICFTHLSASQVFMLQVALL